MPKLGDSCKLWSWKVPQPVKEYPVDRYAGEERRKIGREHQPTEAEMVRLVAGFMRYEVPDSAGESCMTEDNAWYTQVPLAVDEQAMMSSETSYSRGKQPESGIRNRRRHRIPGSV